MFFPLSAVGASCSLFLNLYEILTWSMLPNTKEAELQKLMDFGCVGDVSCGREHRRLPSFPKLPGRSYLHNA